MKLAIKGLRNSIITGWGLSFLYMWFLTDFNVLFFHLLFASTLGGLVSSAALVFYVLPIHFWMSHNELVGLRYYLMVGVIPSIVFIFIPAFTDVTGRLIIESIITYALLGVVLTTVFWFTVYYRKPKRTD
ncbi:hypothetical protein [Pseudoalteromonas umbrosa]|uniref:hypothetical protein n=1 Tax=Pseudoalteromonas umbrosa TaxID=3048489 RepID=UPI0024C33549|nr:hypothetical protein [Pseudoalteromonas sp. B95]MDK1286275.1 hypothetical protein [Pseudoalteromonas sp. B95]